MFIIAYNIIKSACRDHSLFHTQLIQVFEICRDWSGNNTERVKLCHSTIFGLIIGTV